MLKRDTGKSNQGYVKKEETGAESKTKTDTEKNYFKIKKEAHSKTTTYDMDH